jgi:3-methyladenine DNA glycosylase AlkD
MNYDDILKQLEGMSNPEAVAGMARFGITGKKVLGISIPNLEKIAKQTGKDSKLARQLWDSEVHEARILACMIADPEKLSNRQMEQWVKEFESWDICDQCCSRLFRKTDSAWEKAIEWSSRKQEFVKRAGFVMMAQLAVHDKKADNNDFEKFFALIEKHAADDRNYVKKAVNWALRQIGKRNPKLMERAIDVAETIQKTDSKAARWIAADALKELRERKARL